MKKIKRKHLLILSAITVFIAAPFIIIKSHYEKEYTALKKADKIVYIRGINDKMPFALAEDKINSPQLISKYIHFINSIDTTKEYLMVERLPLFCEGFITDTLVFEDTLYKVNVYNTCAWDRKTVLLHKRYINKTEGTFTGYKVRCDDFNRIFSNHY